LFNSSRTSCAETPRVASRSNSLKMPNIGHRPCSTEHLDVRMVEYHEAPDRNTKKVEGRIAKHLTPFFGPNRLLVTITSDTVTSYIADRKKDKPVPTNATINRELAWLKQMFTLAVRAGQLMTRPHIEMLKENNARQGFFERDQIAEV